MHASRTRVMLPVLSVCAVALLLSPASADPALLDPAVGGGSQPADLPADVGGGSQPADLPAEAATLEWAGDDVADTDSDRIAVPPGSQAFMTHHQPSAFSPEQRRGLSRDGGAGSGAASAPAVRHLQRIVDEP
ncbi:unnamed protein product [Urochloa decumbens]|uniref:Uncharacterized protein n=1 Tax=Urochloa decumbens TaxID=240449 RepID=A0ABC9DEN3_9POAL